jgi:uncharacterized protein (DUF2062 family)
VLDEPVDTEHRPEVLAGQSTSVQPPGPALSGWSKWIVKLQDVGKPLLLGTLIFSFGFSALAYLLVNGVWHLRVRLKRRRRLQRRAGP